MARMQRKLVTDVVIEQLTPTQTSLNVEIKSLKKILEECAGQIKDQYAK